MRNHFTKIVSVYSLPQTEAQRKEEFMGRSVFNDPELLMNTLLDLLAEQEGTEIFDREIVTGRTSEPMGETA